MTLNHLTELAMQLNIKFLYRVSKSHVTYQKKKKKFPRVMLSVFSSQFLILFLLLFCRKLLETIMGKLHILHGGIMMTLMNFSGLCFCSLLFSDFII